ncbi:MATE family efflux transporter [Flavonifractor sp. An100]|uniref:MATE family efflux transporter n=1 Tax=Flavonifractor sp. An100 TaxID=1965538 RepID=UPI000B3A087D|nr:MATE family efflux transporter [Flavonifractor sp. An100]OUQ82363.1 MATE family efflux transporter [Flavonifractor sp. An100]
MRKRQYQIDMCSGPLWNKLLLFALPLIASSMLQLLFNAADVVVVGWFAGKEALAAVGSNTSLINLLVNLFIGLSVGTNVVVARDLGAGRHDNVSRSVHTSITLALISGVIMTIFGEVMVRKLLIWMSSPTDVIDLSTIYLRIYFFGMPANLLYNFSAAILRAQGDTQRPLYFLTIAGVINALLNLFFVVVVGMDVDGVAYATIISQYISAALVLRCLMREEGPLHVELKKLGLEWSVVKRILQVGLPAGFQGIIFSLSNVVIQSALNSFDDAVVVAGSAASANIEGFVYAGMNAFYQTALTFSGQNYGAGQCKRVDKVLLWCQAFAVGTGLVLGNLAYLFGNQLAGIYAPGEPDVIAQTVLRLGLVSCPYFLCGFMDTMVGVLRGIGYSVGPMIVSLVGVCGLRLFWVATIFHVFPSPWVLYASYPVTWTITGIVHLVFFLYVRKRAYARVNSGGALAAMEGHHPVQT